MPRLTRDSNIKVGNKEYKVEDLLKTIIYLPDIDIKNYFLELGLTIPRELRMYVLKENLREKVVETRKSRLTMADEINYRLSWFTEFSETQLENLLIFFDDEQTFRNYLEDFWTDLLGYMVEKKVRSDDIKRLYDLSIDHVKKHGLVLPSLKTYNRGLKDIFYDSFGRIDGLAPQKLRPVLYKSSTLGEIRDLGTKYGVNVPRRLKKNELAEIIINELKEEGKYTEELEKKIKGMSVIVMQRYAVDHDIKASTELKKEEIIEYVLKHAEETKETYFVPQSIEEYDKEIHDLSEEVEKNPTVKKQGKEEPKKTNVNTIEESEENPHEDIIVEEPIIEQEIEQVETNVESEEHKQIQYFQESIKLDELIKEIRLLREAIEKTHIERLVEKPEQEEPIEQPEKVDLDDNKPETPQQETEEKSTVIEEPKEDLNIQDEENKESHTKKKSFGKIIKKTLKIIIIIVPSILLLLLIFSLLTYYVPSLTFLDGIEDNLNNLYIGNRGLIEFIHHLFSLIGM
jgi:hypothetical protein